MKQPDIIETLDYEVLLSRLTEHFIALFPSDSQQAWRDTLALESEPVVKVLETLAYLELLVRARINAAARANLLAFATASDLDRLADFYGLTRFMEENDSDFRRRLVARIQGSSTAGPRDHYFAHTLNAHADVRDAHIASPRPGLVVIAVLPKRTADADNVIQAVKDHVLSDQVRVLTDTVQIMLAKYHPVTIRAQMQLSKNADPLTIEKARHALTEHIAQLNLGDALTLSAIAAALHQQGVIGVTIHTPISNVIVPEDTLITLESLELSV